MSIYRTHARKRRELPEDVSVALERAALFARRVAFRHDNPPKWAQARELADQLDAALRPDNAPRSSGR